MVGQCHADGERVAICCLRFVAPQHDGGRARAFECVAQCRDGNVTSQHANGRAGLSQRRGKGVEGKQVAFSWGARQNDPRGTGDCAAHYNLPEATRSGPRQGVLLFYAAAVGLALDDCGESGPADVIPCCDDTELTQAAVKQI